MNAALVEQVVNAVLYEGYILYPYRASAKKNRQRFTFGRVYPEDYSVAQAGAEPCLMQTECLVQRGRDEVGAGGAAAVEISVRFLHPMAREIGELPAPLAELPETLEPGRYRVVPELRLGKLLHQTWQEAVERLVTVPVQGVPALVAATTRDGGGQRVLFAFPASRAVEPIRDPASQQVVAVVVRRQEALAGEIELRAEPVDADVFRLTVRVWNRTPVPAASLGDEEAVLMRTFASTHTVLQAHGAAARFFPCSSRRSGMRRRPRRAKTSASGRCSSARRKKGTATRCSPRRSSFTITRRSPRKAPATCATAARSTKSCRCASRH